MNFLKKTAIFLCLFLACAELFSAEPSEQGVEQIKGSVAVLMDGELKDPLFNQQRRRKIYESWGLRVIRGVYRHTGIDLDQGAFKIKNLEIPIFSIFVLLLLTFILKNKKPKFLLLALMFICLAGWIVCRMLNSDLKSLERWDRSSPGSAQSALDILVGRGMDFEVFSDWNSFEKKWTDSLSVGIQPFHVLVWAGVSQGTDPKNISQFLESSQQLKLIHLAIGPHLPLDFQKWVFADEEAQLIWPKEKSVTARPTAYGRKLSWQSKSNTLEWGLYSKEKNHLLYARSDLSPLKLDKLFMNSLKSLNSAAYSRARLEGLSVLRCDDPGSAQNAYLESWLFPELDVKTWQEVNEILEKTKAKMSLGYVGGWVDDANREGGELWSNGQLISKRVAGETYPSSSIVYKRGKDRVLYDMQSQANYFKSKPSMLDFEVHGWTHVSPETQAWLEAENKYGESSWYREFQKTEVSPFQNRSSSVQKEILSKSWKMYVETFSKKPSTLIPPGHRISADTAQLAKEAGFRMLSARHLALNRGDKMVWTHLIGAMNLEDKKVPEEFLSGYPQVLILHDRDFALHGSSWLSEQFKTWAGATRRFITLRELSLKLVLVPEIHFDRNSKIVNIVFDLSQDELNDLEDTSAKKFSFWFRPPQGFSVIKLPSALKLLSKTKEESLLELNLDKLHTSLNLELGISND